MILKIIFYIITSRCQSQYQSGGCLSAFPEVYRAGSKRKAALLDLPPTSASFPLHHLMRRKIAARWTRHFTQTCSQTICMIINLIAALMCANWLYLFLLIGTLDGVHWLVYAVHWLLRGSWIMVHVMLYGSLKRSNMELKRNSKQSIWRKINVYTHFKCQKVLQYWCCSEIKIRLLEEPDMMTLKWEFSPIVPVFAPSYTTLICKYHIEKGICSKNLNKKNAGYFYGDD